MRVNGAHWYNAEAVRELAPLFGFVHDHFLLIACLAGVGLMFLGWALLEAFTGNKQDDEMIRLRQRLYELERDSNSSKIRSPDPVVLSRRWAQSGAALTSTDGGCFLIVDRVAAAQRLALFTIRVDGALVHRGHALRCGETLELPSRSGTYLVQLYAVDGIQAAVSICLRLGLDNRAALTGD